MADQTLKTRLAPDHVIDGWIQGGQVPQDAWGPTVPFTRFERRWIDEPAIKRFDQVVALHQDKLAVYDGVVRLSYAELQRAIDDLAFRIDAAGPSSMPVAAIIHNTAAYPIALFACLALGRCLVAIDASHPLDRQTAIFEASGASLLLLAADGDVDTSFVPDALARLIISPMAAAGRLRPQRAIDLDQPAGIAFTSGSTGKPKGLACSQRDFLYVVAEHVNVCHINSHDVVLGIASLSAGGAREALSALLSGATLRILDFKSAGLNEALRVLGEEGVTLLSFVPTVLRMIAQVPGVREAFRNLRVLSLGGEELLKTDVALFRAMLPETCLIDHSMGSTEAFVVFRWFVREEAIDGPATPVGFLTGSKSICLVDEQGQAVPPGEAGDLVVKSRHMALGSWTDKVLTRGPFLHDANDPTLRIYSMGDQLRQRPDGLFEFVGRRDRQIKVRGLRANPGDVEAILRTHANVADAVVIARKTLDDAVFVAFISPIDVSDAPSSIALRTMVGEEAPQHMVPIQVHVLPEIPRLANYKPDLVKLEAVDVALQQERNKAAAGATDSASALPSRESIALIVSDAWKSVLRLGSPSSGTTWSESGGDSLKVLQLFFYIEAKLDEPLPLDLMQHDFTNEDLTESIWFHLTEADSLNTSSAKPLVFLLPGLGGDEPRLAAFRNALSKDLQFATLKYPDIDQPTRIISDFNAIVELVLAQISSLQPTGDIAIAGFSFGGFVLLEVVRRLDLSGRRIVFAGVLDTSLAQDPNADEKALEREWAAQERLFPHQQGERVSIARRLSETIVTSMIKHRAYGLIRVFAIALSKIAGAHRNLYIRALLLERLRATALSKSTRQSHLGTIHVFKAAERRERFALPHDLGWGEYALKVVVVIVQGDHWSQFDPPHLENTGGSFLSHFSIATRVK